MSAAPLIDRKLRYLQLIVVVLSVVFAAIVLNIQHKQAPEINGAILAEPQALAAFELRNHRGELVHTADLKGEWQLVSYGYTQCPDICPTMLSSLAQFQKRLDKSGEYRDLRVLFYTIDPSRDTVDKLANYVPWFDARFIGLRAESADEALIFERSLGMSSFLATVDETDGAGTAEYDVAHGFRLYLLDDQARLRAALAPISARDGSKHYDPESLFSDYIALREWFSQQG
ncbi:SCO family protein [Zhongshania guokunii]|uniref:SCO family protein n=1 Tax=Zhongshania guokunii TaxID=641783 RepID=A0ABV3U5I7_9GAMM